MTKEEVIDFLKKCLEFVKTICILLTTLLSILGVSSCTGWQGECSGSFCIKKIEQVRQL